MLEDAPSAPFARASNGLRLLPKCTSANERISPNVSPPPRVRRRDVNGVLTRHNDFRVRVRKMDSALSPPICDCTFKHLCAVYALQERCFLFSNFFRFPSYDIFGYFQPRSRCCFSMAIGMVVARTTRDRKDANTTLMSGLFVRRLYASRRAFRGFSDRLNFSFPVWLSATFHMKTCSRLHAGKKRR